MIAPREAQKFERKTAARCFNQTWDYLVKRPRNANAQRVMLNLAHAAAYHWSQVGTPRNQAVSDWQISRAYAAVNEPRLALTYAKSCLELCKKNHLAEIIPTANEAMARAYAVGKNYPAARKYLDTARKQLEEATTLDREDRAIFGAQQRETAKLIPPRKTNDGK